MKRTKENVENTIEIRFKDHFDREQIKINHFFLNKRSFAKKRNKETELKFQIKSKKKS